MNHQENETENRRESETDAMRECPNETKCTKRNEEDESAAAMTIMSAMNWHSKFAIENQK
jgi:hypothetical protein